MLTSLLGYTPPETEKRSQATYTQPLIEILAKLKSIFGLLRTAMDL